MTRQEMIDGLIEARRLLDTPVAEVHYRRAQAHVLSAIVHLELHPESTPTQTERDSEMCLFAEWINEDGWAWAFEDEKWWKGADGEIYLQTTAHLLTAFRAQKQRYALDH